MMYKFKITKINSLFFLIIFSLNAYNIYFRFYCDIEAV